MKGRITDPPASPESRKAGRWRAGNGQQTRPPRLSSAKRDDGGQTTDQRLKLGVVGVGYLGEFHAQKYASMEEIDLVGLVDIDLPRYFPL
jgi:hypothetical protein